MIHRKILFYVFTLLSIQPIDAQTREEALSEFDWLTGFIDFLVLSVSSYHSPKLRFVASFCDTIQ